MNRERWVCFATGLVALCATGARAQITVYTNGFDGWAAATGAFETIDFQTLPDGSPSFAGAEITESFNYTDWGATFSAPAFLGIGGNGENGYALASGIFLLDPESFIRANLIVPAHSIGFFFPGSSKLELFGVTGNLLATEGSGGFFLGAVSEISIGHVIMDRGQAVAIGSFHFASVPEPVTAGLLLVGGLGVLRRRGWEWI